MKNLCRGSMCTVVVVAGRHRAGSVTGTRAAQRRRQQQHRAQHRQVAVEEGLCLWAGRSTAGWRGVRVGLALLPAWSPAVFAPSSVQEMGIHRSAQLRSFGVGPKLGLMLLLVDIPPSIVSPGQPALSITPLPLRSGA